MHVVELCALIRFDRHCTALQGKSPGPAPESPGAPSENVTALRQRHEMALHEKHARLSELEDLAAEVTQRQRADIAAQTVELRELKQRLSQVSNVLEVELGVVSGSWTVLR